MLNGLATQIVFVSLLSITFSVVGLNLLASAFYEFKQTQFKNRLKKHPHARALRARPQVSLIVMSSDSADKLAKSLESIGRSNYRKYEVLVVSKGSSATVTETVDKFAAKHPSKEVHLLSRRNQKLSSLVRHHTKGELIFVLSDEDYLEPEAILNAVKYLALNPSVDALIPATLIEPGYTLANLIWQFEALFINQWQKARFALARREKSLNRRAFYRRRAVSKPSLASGNLEHYYSGITVKSNVLTFPVNLSEDRFLSRYLRTLWSVAILAEATYALYLARAHNYPRLLLLLWGGSALYLSFCVWGSEYLSLFKKLRMILLAPLVCVLFYVASFIRLANKRPSLAPSKLISKYSSVDFVAPFSARP